MSEKVVDKNTRKIGVVALINLVGFIGEVLGGIFFGSLALLSDAFHMAFDATAYMIAFLSGYVAEKMGEESGWNFGFHRIETMAAFANGTLLIPMASLILWKSYNRFLNPVEIDFLPTLLIGSAGLLINILSVFYLNSENLSLNEKSAYYHLLGDSGGSFAVIISVILVRFTGIRFFDPLTAVIIAGFIFWSASKVLRNSTDILLEKSPVENKELEKEIKKIENVHGVKELRVWSICSRINVATVHICDLSESLEESEETRDMIRKVLREHEVNHSTIQMESHDYDGCDHSIEHTY